MHMLARVLASKPPLRRFSTVATLEVDCLIVGAGAAGTAVSHQLLEKEPPLRVAVVEPSAQHVYQPGLTLVGSGHFKTGDIVMPTGELLPSAATWLNTSVTTLRPEANCVDLADGTTVSYTNLVLCPGLETHWGGIPGLMEGLEEPTSGVCSNYSFLYAPKTFSAATALKTGNALFTQCAMPIKCPGAPQKALYLCEEVWRNSGARPNINIDFHTVLPVIFGAPHYAEPLTNIAAAKGCAVHYKSDLKSINVGDKTATFADVDTGDTTVKPFDFIHVTPHQRAHGFIADSSVSNPGGLVKVDPGTLQSTEFSNVWSLGDASDLQTSKTAAAVSAQAPIVVSNLLHSIGAGDGDAIPAYDGYTSCPIPVGDDKLMLCEFGYNVKPMPTFAPVFDQRVPNTFFFQLKRGMRELYFKGLCTGHWRGVKQLPWVK